MAAGLVRQPAAQRFGSKAEKDATAKDEA